MLSNAIVQKFPGQLAKDLNKWIRVHKGSLDDYPGGEVIGEGATSVIFKSQTSSGPRIIRITDASALSEDETIERLNDLRVETEIMEAVQSKHVTKLFDTIISDLNVCHIMEVAHSSLEVHIPDGGLTATRSMACMYQILEGLSFMHRNGFIHYDVKPANVLVFKNGLLKLTDFDVSARTVYGKPIDNYGDVAEKHEFRGSLSFMAPEVAGAWKIGDATKADIFSAGRTFLFVLTKHRFFSRRGRKNLEQLILDTLQKNPITEAVRMMTETKTETCNRCKNLLLYTLNIRSASRKPAAWIVNKMQTWTWRPSRYGFNLETSQRIVAEMVAEPALRF